MAGDGKRMNYAREIAYELYQRGHSSKTALVTQLGVSLPTVLQNVRLLMENGLVVQTGQMESRGGRKADALALNADHSFAIGADVTRNHLSLVAVDLRGTLRWHERLSLPFAADDSYARLFQQAVGAFLKKHELAAERVLGVGLSVPGILSADGRTLVYSHALGVRNHPLDALGRCCGARMIAVNDANAAALAERRLLPPKGRLAYLSLSNSVGGAVLMNGALYLGDHGRSAEFGHMTVVPDGRECYCGKLGCFDAYGSALRLSAAYHGKLAEFFRALSAREPQAQIVWEEYRRYLAIMCNQLRMAFDCTVMLGGYVGAFLEPYLPEIAQAAARLNTFEPSGQYICCCKYKTEAAALGAALLHIERFFDTL